MRSEFEKYFKENHADSFYSVDAALEMRGDDYIDFQAADLWALWQHRQTEVDELQKQAIDQGQRFNEQAQHIKDLEHKSAEIQKRVDAALAILTEYYTGSYDESPDLVVDIEQALKGGIDEAN